MRLDPQRLQRGLQSGFRLALVLAIALPWAGKSRAQESAAPPPDDGAVYLVSDFELTYRAPHADHPPLHEVVPVRVELGRVETGYVAPRADAPLESIEVGVPGANPVRPFHASAIAEIDRQVLAAFQRAGLLGVFVAPHPDDVAAGTDEDLRAPDETRLRLMVWTGRIKDVRTVARGSRIDPEWRINNKVHRRFHQLSPLQPPGHSERSTDLLLEEDLEEFLFRMNRYPGRHVEAALSPTPEGDGVILDYQVSEAKPWYIYGLATNTGTPLTGEWQQRYGFVHRQLTDRDDTLSIEYANTGLSEVHSVRLAYDAPWFGPDRPSWMRKQPQDPSWINRSAIPWWGVDKLRWDAYFAWNRFDIEPVAGTDEYLGQEFAGGAGLTYNVFQHRSFFIDVGLGFQIRDIEVEDATFFTESGSGHQLFFLPTLELEMERLSEYSSFRAWAGYEVSPLDVDEDEVDLLGRLSADGRYHLLRWDASVYQYLEPLLLWRSWRNPKTKWSSTLAHELMVATRGQYGFEYRLIPQVSESLGGLYSIRGYPQSEAVGDTVYLATAEYRWHLPRSLPIRRKPTHLPLVGDFRLVPQHVYGTTDWDLILRGFVDAGRTIRNRRELGAAETDNDLLSAGAGVELTIGSNVRARMDWGYALKTTYFANGEIKTPKGNTELHFLFSLLY